jgi:hypothetical protein
MEARIDCTRCRQYLVTWRPETPRGCRLYGFEGLRLPSLVVHEATGAPCQGFDPRATASAPPAQRAGVDPR